MRIGWIWVSTVLMVAVHQIDAEQNTTRSCRCKPVFLMHGYMVYDRFMQPLKDMIEKARPGTKIFNSDAYGGIIGASTPLWDQIHGQLGKQFLDFCAENPGGIILIGHSQGALLVRALVEVFSNNCVHTLISIAGPMRGQFGPPAILPQLVNVTQIPILNWGITDFFYLREIQERLSIANFWYDPNRFDMYCEKNIFLPLINNEVISNSSECYKENFLKLSKHVTIGGPGDTTIKPWQSSLYGFWDKDGNMEDAKDSEIYKKDLFGLRTLDETGRWFKHIVPGMRHVDLAQNEHVFNETILPYLDCIKEENPYF